MEYIVLGCYNCPFKNEDDKYGTSCNHPNEEANGEDIGYIKKGEHPNFCPLLIEPIIVKAKFQLAV